MAEKPEDLNLPNAVISRLAKEAVRLFNLEFKKKIALEYKYNVWMLETTQRISKLLGLLLPDLLVKKCSYQTCYKTK